MKIKLSLLAVLMALPAFAQRPPHPGPGPGPVHPVPNPPRPTPPRPQPPRPVPPRPIPHPNPSTNYFNFNIDRWFNDYSTLDVSSYVGWGRRVQFIDLYTFGARPNGGYQAGAQVMVDGYPASEFQWLNGYNRFILTNNVGYNSRVTIEFANNQVYVDRIGVAVDGYYNPYPYSEDQE